MTSSTRVPSIKLNMKNPYSAETHRKCVPIWKKVYPTFKDLQHRPPFELAYASYLNLINHIKKSNPCTHCHKPLEGDGLYFPLESHHIMPLPCCEKCCTKYDDSHYYSMDSKSPNQVQVEVKNDGIINKEVRKFIYVNKYQRSIKFYSWKMMVCANLVVPMYNKMMKEEDMKKAEALQIIQNLDKEQMIENLNEEQIIQINDLYKYETIDVLDKESILNINNNYYFENIQQVGEYDTSNLHTNLCLTNIDEIEMNKNQNILMIFISFIATILASTFYYIFNK